MKSIDWDTIIAFLGLLFILAGVYLWLGLEAVLILFGIVLIYIGARVEFDPPKENENEPDKATDTQVF